jgi:hypothetical protein
MAVYGRTMLWEGKGTISCIVDGNILFLLFRFSNQNPGYIYLLSHMRTKFPVNLILLNLIILIIIDERSTSYEAPHCAAFSSLYYFRTLKIRNYIKKNKIINIRSFNTKLHTTENNLEPAPIPSQSPFPLTSFVFSVWVISWCYQYPNYIASNGRMADDW